MRKIIRLSGGVLCAVYMSHLAGAAVLTPTLGQINQAHTSVEAYAVSRGISPSECFDQGPCTAHIAMPFQGGAPEGWLYYGEMGASADALVLPGTLAVHTSISASGFAVCDAAPCGPLADVVAFAYASFGENLLIDVPAPGTLTFDLAIDGGTATRYVYTVQPGLQAIIPLVLRHDFLFTITAESESYIQLQRSLIVSNIQLVPEPEFCIPIGLALLAIRWRRQRT